MRFIHTADWHLGRTFYNVPLVEDQAYVLRQVIDLAKEAKPDILIISGDIYDRAVPPTDAVELLDDTLCRLILDLKIPTILIAGNHDSPQRLQFAARLMESLRLYVFGTIPDQAKFIQLYDESGAVCFYAMPYVDPAVVREHWRNDHITTHESVLRAWVELIKQKHPSNARTVLINHEFVVGGEACDSERPISIGGSGTINADCFDGFHYVALGHLHRPQTLGKGQIHYSGSLLKYSFSEADHIKSVNLVNMDGAGHCVIERIPLTARRDVRYVEGHINDLLQALSIDSRRHDYVKVRLLDQGAILDAMGRLRENYPNVMEIERPGWMPEPGQPAIKVDHRSRDVVSLFADFYQQVTSEELNPEQKSAFSSVIERLYQGEHEVSE